MSTLCLENGKGHTETMLQMFTALQKVVTEVEGNSVNPSHIRSWNFQNMSASKVDASKVPQ